VSKLNLGVCSHDYLVLHDNHFVKKNKKSFFETSTFHLFLQGFNGKAHLCSPSLDWSEQDDPIVIDSVVIRPRRGYGRAKDFYASIFRNALISFTDIYRILKGYDALVIAGPCCSAPFAHLAAWMLGKPVVGYVIGDNRAVVAFSKEYVGVRRWIAKIVARWEWLAMARLARRHHVIALGKELAESLSHYGKLVSLGFTSLIREDQIVQDKAFQPADTLSLLTVGRVSQEKGIQCALRAVVLLKQNGILVNYTVVGDGPDLQRLRAMVEELGISAQVKFVGARPFSELFEHYQAADIFILPSQTEGVAKALLEAMANRLPVVATRVGGNPWVLGNGERGILISYGDEREIVDAVRQYATDPQFRREKLEAATSFIRQNTMEASAEKIMRIIEAEKEGMTKC
jgi:glycosyltransferase involved in cell wall biosynthesis